jgi:hypothetical protein
LLFQANVRFGPALGSCLFVQPLVRVSDLIPGDLFQPGSERLLVPPLKALDLHVQRAEHLLNHVFGIGSAQVRPLTLAENRGRIKESNLRPSDLVFDGHLKSAEQAERSLTSFLL